MPLPWTCSGSERESLHYFTKAKPVHPKQSGGQSHYPGQVLFLLLSRLICSFHCGKTKDTELWSLPTYLCSGSTELLKLTDHTKMATEALSSTQLHSEQSCFHHWTPEDQGYRFGKTTLSGIYASWWRKKESCKKILVSVGSFLEASSYPFPKMVTGRKM